MLRGLTTAIRTLTWIPMPGRDVKCFADALPWFPGVGLLIGALLYVLAELAGANWPMGAALLVLLAGTLITRGLHLDGLADAADGLFGGHTREQRLAIMKDSRMGAFGGIALALTLLAKFVLLTRLAETGGIIWIIPVFVVSRTTQSILPVLLPYARAEGTAREFITGARWYHALLAIVIAGIILHATGIAPMIWMPALAAGLSLTLLLAQSFRKQFGGITGDLIGATNELVEIAILCLGCLLWPACPCAC